MSDQENGKTGWTKLYHPKGPLVSLPVIGDSPAAMFAFVTACLDAGFVVAAPGLEVGEEREMVNGVLRGEFEHEGEVTPIILLYAANEAMKWSILKVYLNSDDDTKAFEAACGLKLESLPLYEAKDKPERDGGKMAQKYIVKLAKPVPIIFKQNPKWSEEESNAAKAAAKPYTKPRRVFVRWADAPTPQTLPHAEPLTDMQVAESAWKVRLQNVLTVEDMNKLIPMVRGITEEPIRKRAWTMCLKFAEGKKWVLDSTTKAFRHAAELPLTQSIPPDALAAAFKPNPPSVATPPPPDDQSPAKPLIVEWQKKLAGDVLKDFEGTTRADSERGLAKLNGEILTTFKAIPKAEKGERGQIWAMILEFAKKYGCEFDGAKFVERVP